MKIEDIEVSQEDVGKRVRYVPLHANGDLGHPDVEEGIITSFNEYTVFVRYGSDLHSKGTYPTDLVWG